MMRHYVLACSMNITAAGIAAIAPLQCDVGRSTWTINFERETRKSERRENKTSAAGYRSYKFWQADTMRSFYFIAVTFLLLITLIDSLQLRVFNVQKNSRNPFTVFSSIRHESNQRPLTSLSATPILSLPNQVGGTNWWIWSLLATSSSLGIVLENTKIGAMLSSPLVTMGLSLLLCNVGILPSSSPVYSTVLKVRFQATWSFSLEMAFHHNISTVETPDVCAPCCPPPTSRRWLAEVLQEHRHAAESVSSWFDGHIDWNNNRIFFRYKLSIILLSDLH